MKIISSLFQINKKVVLKLAVSLIRTIVLYVIIVFALKLMGKRQISDLQTSELVITILISNIAAIPMQNTEQPLLTGVVPIGVLICCEILVSFLMLKSYKMRELICGKPVVVIDEGKIQQSALEYLRLSVEDLFEQLRQLDIFTLEDVWVAIMETNGQLSVLKRSEKQPPDAGTLGIQVPKASVDTVVVSDGNICDFSLKVCGLDRKWVEEIAGSQGVDIKDIFIMTANKTKKYNIIKKEGA